MQHIQTRTALPEGTPPPPDEDETLLPPWDDAEARVLLAQPDTVYFSVDAEVSDEMWDLLEVEQQTAKDIYDERQAEYAPPWLDGVMATTGARGGYRFRIERPDCTIKVLKGVANRPPLYVEMRAMDLHLHERGALGACEDACAYIRNVLLPDWEPDKAQAAVNLDVAKCSRLDLHLDWQGGWLPQLTDAQARLFMCPRRCVWHPWMSGNNFTGYHFGKGKVQARIYNKTNEVKQKPKQQGWYLELLRQRNGDVFNPDLAVYRLEFQLLRDGVKGFYLYSKPNVTDDNEDILAELECEDLPRISNVRKALHWSPQIWDYLTRRWLRLVEIDDDANRARWPLHPTWRVLQEGYQEAQKKH